MFIFRTLVLVCTFFLLLQSRVLIVNAAGPGVVLRTLQQQDAYIAPIIYQKKLAKVGDVQRLEGVARVAATHGVPEKFVLLGSLPSPYGKDTYAAAYQLQKNLNFSGVLIMVSRWGIAVVSDRLSLGDVRAVEQATQGQCFSQGFTTCAASAGQGGEARITSSQDTKNRNSSIAGFLVLALVVAAVLFLVRRTMRGRQRTRDRSNELRNAASNTLAVADEAVNAVEQELRRGSEMPADVRHDYESALALRQQAEREMAPSQTDAVLTQANQDAAHSVLALQGVMRSLNINSPLSSPLEQPDRRCFYCGRDDRPPYDREKISDDKGNTMDVDVCSVDRQQIDAGRKPQIETVPYNGTQMPWWAVPSSPWYYSYGGPTWQYWLPFMVGMDVGSWMGGGWYGSGFGGGYGYDDGGSSWNDGSPQIDSGTMDPSSDHGAGAFGGWDSGGSGGTDSGGGWDSGGGGGWDSGGDGGGWDSGGGGGDSGGGW